MVELARMSHQPSGFKSLMQSRGGESDIGQANLSTQHGNYNVWKATVIEAKLCLSDFEHTDPIV